MNRSRNAGSEMPASFDFLTPDLVVDLVEKATNETLTGLCRPLNSYINRVFELQNSDGVGIIAKFYRPGRWSKDALQDEHDFLRELDDHEIPVVPPIRSSSGDTLIKHNGVYFTLFPKKLGRALDEPDIEQWEMLGRLLARVHNVGAIHPPRDRVWMVPEESTKANVDLLLSMDVIAREHRREYESVAREIIKAITPMFRDTELIRIHGDCHRGNIVNRLGESLFLIDFDDMVVGPPVQDFWMLLPDAPAKSRAEIEMFLDGYSTFREFDRTSLRLIEPLRAMRYIHFTAWCAVQNADTIGASRLVQGWGTPSYWREAVRDLREQLHEIQHVDDDSWWSYPTNL
jgi:Ser/Thr protein kinase RdoA (MazF antagonist)